MKVAFVSTMTAAPWGGSEELWSATAREALDAGWGVGVSTRYWPDPPRAIVDLVGRGALWWPRRDTAAPEPARGWRQQVVRWAHGGRPAPAASLFQPVFEFQPDVICISQGGTFDFLLHDDLCELLRDSSLPYVVLCRFNTDDFLVHELLQPRAAAFLTGARHVAFAAARNLETAERQLGVELPRASVVQSPVRLPDFAAVPWAADAVPRLACVSRLEAAYKGQDLLLESLGTAAWRARDWRLSFYGEGPDRARLEHLVRFYGLSDRVSFAGHVDDIPGIWETHHLLVLPSRAEGTPQALIQAMISGRPAVVTDVGGVTAWLTEPETGFVAEGATAPSIRRGLERAWDARDTWPLMGQAARRVGLSRIDRTPGKTLLKILQSAVGAVQETAPSA